MASRLIIFDADEFRQLLVHYFDGNAIPLNSEVKEVGVSKYLQRIISLNIASKDWGDEEVSPVTGELFPLELAYEGKRVMSFQGKGQDAQWADANDAPKLQ